MTNFVENKYFNPSHGIHGGGPDCHQEVFEQGSWHPKVKGIETTDVYLAGHMLKTGTPWRWGTPKRRRKLIRTGQKRQHFRPPTLDMAATPVVSLEPSTGQLTHLDQSSLKPSRTPKLHHSKTVISSAADGVIRTGMEMCIHMPRSDITETCKAILSTLWSKESTTNSSIVFSTS